MARPLPTLRVTAALAVIATLALAGCATKAVAPLPPADTGPVANSPANAVKRFEWAMGHKSPETVRGLLSDDFVFIGAALDSSGKIGSAPQGGRNWFADALAAMDSTSTRVTCLMDEHPIALPDPRPGMDPRFHKQVRSAFDLRVSVRGDLGGDELDTDGNLLLFVTRGDSASIPVEVLAQGVRPDSTQWWIERMEDETFTPGRVPSATEPTRNWTFAAMLELFHSLIAH